MKKEGSVIIKKKKFPYALFLGLIILIVICSSFHGTIGGDDMWWHVKTGENVLKNGFSHYDTYSWLYAGKNIYWISHEWLADIILYGIVALFGINSMYVYSLGMILAICFVIIYLNRNHIGKNILMSIIWMILGVNALLVVGTPRPHLMMFVILAVFVFILQRFLDSEKDTKSIWLLPVLSILWANIHGASSNLVYILPIIAITMSLFDMSFGRVKMKRLPRRKLKILLLITVLDTLALFIGPHTYQTLIYPYMGMGEKFQLGFIQEWAVPDISEEIGLKMLMAPMLMVITLCATKKKILLRDLALFGFFAVLTLKALRFGAFFFVACSFLFFKYIPDFYPYREAIKLSDRIPNLKIYLPKLRAYKWIAVLLVGIFAVSSVLAVAKYERILYNKNGYIVEAQLKTEMIEAIKKDNPKRLYNHYNFGGELIYNDIPVFIDSRADLYFGKVLENGMELAEMRDMKNGEFPFDFDKIMNEYRFDAYLTYSTDAFFEHMKENYELNIVETDEDNDIVYFRVVKEKDKCKDNQLKNIRTG